VNKDICVFWAIDGKKRLECFKKKSPVQIRILASFLLNPLGESIIK
jgi:hypothetical protein